MDIIEKITNALKELNEIDEYYEELPNKQSQVDMAISDLYHYIETNSMNTKSSYRIVKELKEHLIERRKYKEDFELLKTFNLHKNKLLQFDNRKMLLAEVGKMQKKLETPYKNRVYEEQELEDKLNN